MSVRCRGLGGLAVRGINTSAATRDQRTADAAADEGEFRVLELGGRRSQARTRRNYQPPPTLPPRYSRQKVDQDWGSAWPAARSFHPAAVPLPVRQGYPATSQPTPDKWGNAELVKIPNFLHLTPPVVARQCEAIKKFCTAWPAGLDTPEQQERHFPLSVSVSSYLHSSTSIRDTKARIVTFRVRVGSLGLDTHGRDKLLRLVGDRYDPATDVLTLTADRCPLSTQNRDYCTYLLTVLYNEAMKTEPWEGEKGVEDREQYVWVDSPSQAAVLGLGAARGQPLSQDVLDQYCQAVTNLHNEGEDEATVAKYRESVLGVLGLSSGGPGVSTP